MKTYFSRTFTSLPESSLNGSNQLRHHRNENNLFWCEMKFCDRLEVENRINECAQRDGSSLFIISSQPVHSSPDLHAHSAHGQKQKQFSVIKLQVPRATKPVFKKQQENSECEIWFLYLSILISNAYARWRIALAIRKLRIKFDHLFNK